MKKYILALLILFIGSVGALHAQGIEFSHANWNDIKAQAKNEHKLIFLDFYTVWCSPCKKMAMEVFPLPEAGDFFNKHFINVKVDAEKGEGKDLAETFRPTGYPTLVFTDADGKQLYRTGGAESAAELIKYGKIALNPQEDYERLKEKYDKNVLGKEDLYRYMIIVKAKGQDTRLNDIFDRYFSFFNAASKEAFDMMEEYINSSDSKSFKYLQAHQTEFYRLAGKDRVNGFIKKILFEEMGSQFFYYDRNEPLDRYLAAKANLKMKVSVTEKEELRLDNFYYRQVKDEDNFIKTAAALIEKYFSKNDEEISMFLGGANIVKKEANLLLLKKWAEMAVAIQDNSLNYLSLAMICNRLNDKANALKYIDLCTAASKRDDDGKIDLIARFKKQIIQ